MSKKPILLDEMSQIYKKGKYTQKQLILAKSEEIKRN